MKLTPVSSSVEKENKRLLKCKSNLKGTFQETKKTFMIVKNMSAKTNFVKFSDAMFLFFVNPFCFAVIFSRFPRITFFWWLEQREA